MKLRLKQIGLEKFSFLNFDSQFCNNNFYRKSSEIKFKKNFLFEWLFKHYANTLIMKFIIVFLLSAIPLVSKEVFAADPVKMSNSGICHAPNTTYYAQTKNFTPYKTLDECLKAGGRLPKK